MSRGRKKKRKSNLQTLRTRRAKISRGNRRKDKNL